MRTKREIKTAIETLRLMQQACGKNVQRAVKIGGVIEILYWSLNHPKHGRGFGDFIARTESQIDQVRAEERDEATHAWG